MKNQNLQTLKVGKLLGTNLGGKFDQRLRHLKGKQICGLQILPFLSVCFQDFLDFRSSNETQRMTNCTKNFTSPAD
jgi:hypothetical protein